MISPRIAVLASGEGTTLQAIMEACNVVLVISNNSDSGALRRARQFNVPGIVVGKTAQSDLDMLAILESSGADLVVLAGYLQKVGKLTLKAYQGRIINTHPSLLPKHGGKGMYGRRVHQAVLDSGDTETGVTIHLVTNDYDTGDIIAQCVVPVMPSDTVTSIEKRVKAIEKRMICTVIQNWHYSGAN
ncbi:MAG: phosphoribosylglycinamide formyltransferase [Methylococcaceae bacterium]|nr:phosphoribosylglycinamide formyltransferase [Methylococcaceae bacterium]